ncbi:MAG: hypothetical protein JWM85_3272 [Acidimicrobiaceae bacterium]|nr:hypothetical protein [Acidimicrobiaceae bacterium]
MRKLALLATAGLAALALRKRLLDLLTRATGTWVGRSE